MGDSDHFELLMCELRTLRGEVHEMRREMKSETVRLAMEVQDLQAWKNKQIGAFTLGGLVAGAVGALLVKVWSAVVGRIS